MKMREVGAPLVGAQGGNKGRTYVGYFQRRFALPFLRHELQAPLQLFTHAQL